MQTEDRIAASNFSRAATESGVKRIIYLGGLVHENEEQSEKLSEHMRSRWEVGQILKKSAAKVTIFRSSLSYLVREAALFKCFSILLRDFQQWCVLNGF